MDATLLGALGTIIAWTAGAGRNTKTDNPSSVIVISSFRSRCQAQPNLEIDDGLPLARGGDALRYAGATRIAPATASLHHVLGHDLTTDGLPLGMVAVKFWNRKKFKGTAALKRKVNPTRVPIEGKESMRWLANLRQSTELLGEASRCIHIADRAGDIWELFYLARELDTHFLVRRCVDRVCGDGSHKVSDAMAEVKVQGLHRVAWLPRPAPPASRAVTAHVGGAAICSRQSPAGIRMSSNEPADDTLTQIVTNHLI